MSKVILFFISLLYLSQTEYIYRVYLRMFSKLIGSPENILGNYYVTTDRQFHKQTNDSTRLSQFLFYEEFEYILSSKKANYECSEKVIFEPTDVSNACKLGCENNPLEFQVAIRVMNHVDPKTKIRINSIQYLREGVDRSFWFDNFMNGNFKITHQYDSALNLLITYTNKNPRCQIKFKLEIDLKSEKINPKMVNLILSLNCGPFRNNSNQCVVFPVQEIFRGGDFKRLDCLKFIKRKTLKKKNTK